MSNATSAFQAENKSKDPVFVKQEVFEERHGPSLYHLLR